MSEVNAMHPYAVGFRYKVNIEGNKHKEDMNDRYGGFSEVSGISAEIETETVYSGGDNESSYSLPTRMKHSDLVLKRGFIDMYSDLSFWVLQIMEGNFLEIETQNIIVELVDEEDFSIMSWTFKNAFPVKWEVSNFNAMENKIVLESISFRYTNFVFSF